MVPAMEEESAVAAHEVFGTEGLVEHRAHGEPPAAKDRVPDLLTLEGQQIDMPEFVGDA